MLRSDFGQVTSGYFLRVNKRNVVDEYWPITGFWSMLRPPEKVGTEGDIVIHFFCYPNLLEIAFDYCNPDI